VLLKSHIILDNLLFHISVIIMFRARNLDLGSGHTAYHHTSLIDLYLHTKFHWHYFKHHLKTFLFNSAHSSHWL